MNIDDLTLEERSKLSPNLVTQLEGSSDEDQKYEVMVFYGPVEYIVNKNPSEPPDILEKIETLIAFIDGESQHMTRNGMTVREMLPYVSTIRADLSQDYICSLAQRDLVDQIMDADLADKPILNPLTLKPSY